ncbi:Aspartic protease 6 [Aphelenchoides besseyi]|nr:Aspartic protease 6 [Aphelenchoides besseyi]
MSTMLIGGLLIATTLVTFVDAGSWKIPIQEVERVNRNNRLGPLNDVYPEPLHLDRKHYRATIYLGTSSMPFRVMVDTGSHILWVPKIGCRASGTDIVGNCVSGEHVYDPSKSTRAKNLNAPFYVEYGNGNAWTRGQCYVDVFSFGEKMRVKYPIIFGVAEEMRNEDQGILGLGHAYDPGERGGSILHQAWRHKLIDAPVFTIYLQKCPESEDCEKRGMITIGSYDKEMCGEVVGHVDINPNSIKWLFELSKFKLGSASISKSFKAMTDSGAPGIYMPTYAYHLLMSLIKATRTDDGRYVVRCDAEVDVTLQINGKEYTIPGHVLLVNLHNGFCSLRLFPYNHADDVWIIGTPLNMVYCITHNFEAHTVEFAPALTR